MEAAHAGATPVWWRRQVVTGCVGATRRRSVDPDLDLAACDTHLDTVLAIVALEIHPDPVAVVVVDLGGQARRGVDRTKHQQRPVPRDADRATTREVRVAERR